VEKPEKDLFFGVFLEKERQNERTKKVYRKNKINQN
jgi:hypothetical protein